MNAISSHNIELKFQDCPFKITEIKNRLTGEIISLQAKQAIFVRLPKRVSEPEVLTVRSCSVVENGIKLEFANETNDFRADILLTDSEFGLRLHLYVTAPESIWLVEWQLSGLRFDEVIVPALGGQVLSSEMPNETTLSYKYPFWWNAQFVIGATRQGGFWLRSQEVEPNLKILRVKKVDECFELTYGFEANAPLHANTLETELFMDCYEDIWQNAVDRHRSWLEEAFSLKSLERNAHFPAWARKINFVLEMWGVRKDRIQPLHTFEQMVERLHHWRNIHPPEQTLVYLPGFAENGIDSNAPDYNPSSRLGGDSKFKQLVDAAHDWGYRVMIHTNVLAMTFAHHLYPMFKEYQVVDLFDRPQGWGMDMDGDWLTEPYFAYINPGTTEWGDLMLQVLGELIDKFNLDAVFLDQTLLAFNVSKGPNFISGMRRHIERLQNAFPGVLFAGEGLHEHVVSALPMAQIHGIDSLAEVHGMEGQRPWRKAHPVSTYLFGRYTRFLAHLLTKHPSHPMFRLQEDAYAELGVAPALVLYDSSQSMDIPEVREMIKRTETAW